MKEKLTYLIASTAFMLISAASMAQGGLTPLVGSTHIYTIVAEDDVNNELTWSVIGGIAGTDYTVNSGAAAEQVSITWLTAGSYTVQFTEENATSCIATKTLSVTVSANTFDVSASNPDDVCNAADGQANYAGPNTTTTITFTVEMTTANSGFSPNWEITFTLTPAGSATISNVASSAGTLSGTGPYTVTAIPSASGNGTVDVTLDVNGGIYATQSVVLTITSARELTYNTPDVDNTDWTATQTINAIPQTSAITTD
jgi:hypothetical protein